MHRSGVSSTALLCYGQMATHAGKQVLPWADNIASRVGYHFSCSTYVSPGLALGSGAAEPCACVCVQNKPMFLHVQSASPPPCPSDGLY